MCFFKNIWYFNCNGSFVLSIIWQLMYFTFGFTALKLTAFLDEDAIHVCYLQTLWLIALFLLSIRSTARKEPFVKLIEPARKKHLAARDVDLSNVPKIENVLTDAASLASNAQLESNSDIMSLSCSTDSESCVPLIRDTGHDRSTDNKTDGTKGKEELELEVSVEPSPLLAPKDSGDVVMKNSELSLLATEGCGGESSSRPSMQEDTAAEARTDNCSSLATPSSSQVQDMECEEPKGCNDEEAAVATPSSTQSQEMECEGHFGTSVSHFDFNQNGSACVIEVSNFSGHSSEPNTGYNIDPNMAVSSSSASMPKRSDDSELKSDLVTLENHPLGSINEVDKLINISYNSGGSESLPPLLENGSVGKPKPIFSLGFLDRPTGESCVAHEKRTRTDKPEVATSTIANGDVVNGHANGQIKPKNNDSAAASGLQFERGNSTPSNPCMAFSRGILKNGQANGRAPAEVALRSGVCSSGTSSLSVDVPLHNKGIGCSPSSNGVPSRSVEGKSNNGIAECSSNFVNGKGSQDEHLRLGECNGLGAKCNGE